ncbi:MAG TPA: phytanoyl-CoA dioxygenase family protein [Candidatus Kapabacteria bacterium]|nr:phytanoyl-CoA dioxygenase family protein [Candidatus Kapabacteria bacterium]
MLTPDQLRSFRSDGFIVLPRFIDLRMCELLQLAAETWVDAGLALREKGEPLFHHAFIAGPDKIIHVEQLHRYDRIEALEIAGMPSVRALIEQMCGRDAAWIYEGLHIHTPLAPVRTPWMQDAIFESTDERDADTIGGINLVLYLDPVPEGEHGYYFLPGSHEARQDICAIRDERGWDTSGLSYPEVGQGDLLIYHPMLAHSFKADREREGESTSGWMVRTLEFWYRNTDVAAKDFPTDWLEERRRLTGLAAWVNTKLQASNEGESTEGHTVESMDVQRARLYQTVKDDLIGSYSTKVVYPSANFCLDFKPGDRISVD